MPLLDQFKRGVDVAKFKADQLMRVNRVQTEIGGLRREILNAREKIATAVVDLHKQGTLTHPELRELCAVIDQVEAQIAEKEAHIAAIRAEVPPQPQSPAATTSAARPANPCPNCRFDVPAGAAFCTNCGQPMPKPSEPAASTDSRKCSNCGHDVPSGVAFCSNCGTPMASSNPTSG
ncbi:MAG TPA: zinc-ribbon domain-containing protein [Anaerolineae bacterium]